MTHNRNITLTVSTVCDGVCECIVINDHLARDFQPTNIMIKICFRAAHRLKTEYYGHGACLLNIFGPNSGICGKSLSVLDQ